MQYNVYNTKIVPGTQYQLDVHTEHKRFIQQAIFLRKILVTTLRRYTNLFIIIIIIIILNIGAVKHVPALVGNLSSYGRQITLPLAVYRVDSTNPQRTVTHRTARTLQGRRGRSTSTYDPFLLKSARRQSSATNSHSELPINARIVISDAVLSCLASLAGFFPVGIAFCLAVRCGTVLCVMVAERLRCKLVETADKSLCFCIAACSQTDRKAHRIMDGASQ